MFSIITSIFFSGLFRNAFHANGTIIVCSASEKFASTQRNKPEVVVNSRIHDETEKFV